MAVEFGDTQRSLSETLTGMIAAIRGNTITLRQLMIEIGEQGFLLLCALLTLPFLIPVSIPGVSTVFGAAIILISLAITLNRLPWLPKRILDREIETEKLVPTLRKGAALVSKLDRYVRPRLNFLTEGTLMNRFNGLMIMAGGVLLMFPLGLIPLSNTLPGIAILLLSVGIIQRDGLMVAGGYLFLVATTIYFAVLGYAAFAAGQGLSHFFVS
ncbi:exopolysaccharide biosynthesis protein [Sinorhizobium medicae]|uniref:protein ExoD n=2 Tax=Sinorhizobium medicae TaxID=110321 RepID=A0A508WZT9_9HYPH|nr:exopolysaccharide biosynthesis protein [Sinorhizobium medicae]ABR62291.1 Exopolysaccharide synthesis ExoD [Sinorhizobium medicae WSM419]MBO1940830.1 exopolysaccharide biosynthesis protein [Sinorhizobium medicae]MBO1964077.1 exopolysaccharide biosynthesis protein [Sinorhizobium medicae]MDX0405826.1 exopolysaccharide biosynthesis protein [Sinorhizobium medicae]MDX0411387.1 exopolysaccharide biosynthesis protein [Sinorhizobium medicae]